MSSNKRSSSRKKCSEVVDEDLENALLDYVDAHERTVAGRYRCRDCGKQFDTLEEHDRHYRKVHKQAAKTALSGMSM
ncbi:MAG: hypothetical protein NWE98_06100 [Candidatus Bathyarchaeota archaeon]|nr:hypothetical protein [Candidatus Bathyarchaeota archaeon]